MRLQCDLIRHRFAPRSCCLCFSLLWIEPCSSTVQFLLCCLCLRASSLSGTQKCEPKEASLLGQILCPNNGKGDYGMCLLKCIKINNLFLPSCSEREICTRKNHYFLTLFSSKMPSSITIFQLCNCFLDPCFQESIT